MNPMHEMVSNFVDILLYLSVLLTSLSASNSEDDTNRKHWDKRGYIIYCPCMGRFGNQAEQFIGVLAFAKNLDRTLVLPPWRTYKNVPFDEWFDIKPLEDFHRIILADEFMRSLAPSHWPPGSRQGWCWNIKDDVCEMKLGNPFGPFWDGLGVEFDGSVVYKISYNDIDKWKIEYPPDKYPVLAFKGAPSPFPAKQQDIELQKYVKWSNNIEKEATRFIDGHINGQSFIGIHLRNGIDWERACAHTNDAVFSFMSSAQCLGYTREKKVTIDVCLPSKEEILRLTAEILISSNSKHVFVATDNDPMLDELTNHLKNQNVQVHYLNPHLPQIDLFILGKSDHFIGNCVSSFSAFVARERLVSGKPTSYWSWSAPNQKTEL